MEYQSLYRRFRPGRFSEMIGQEHVVLALRNAVRENRVGHAYLLSGPRGTGKTTAARVLAKVLNCETPVDGEPCGECASCKAVETGTSFDLHELDAASHNKVDDIRDLLSKVHLGTPGRTKVYLLDEVHMLTAGAENALLKTLEEPPDHVVFVLATTEPHKVVPTIRSRTQHLELSLVPADEMTRHVRWVAEQAGLEVDDAAVAHVVRVGGGSVRDTLSALDQVVAAGGVARPDLSTDDLVDAIATSDTGQALAAVAAAMSRGTDPRTIGEQLIRALRDVFLTAMGADTSHVAPGDRSRVDDLAGVMRPAVLTRALELVGSALVDMRQSPDARIDLEVALVRLTRPEADHTTAALAARIDRLEAVLAGGAPVSAPPAPTSPPAPTPPPAPAAAPEPASSPPVVIPPRPDPAAPPPVVPSPDVAEAPSDPSPGEPLTHEAPSDPRPAVHLPDGVPTGGTASDEPLPDEPLPDEPLPDEPLPEEPWPDGPPSHEAPAGEAPVIAVRPAPTVPAAPSAPPATEAAGTRPRPADAARRQLANRSGRSGPSGPAAAPPVPADQPPPVPPRRPSALPRPGEAVHAPPSPAPAEPPSVAASDRGASVEAPEPAPAPPSSPAPAASAGPGDGPTDVPTKAELDDAWPTVLPLLSKRASLRVTGGAWAESTSSRVVYALPHEGHRKRCEEVSEEIAAALTAHFGRPVRLALAVEGPDPTAPQRAPTSPSAPEPLPDDDDVDLGDLVDAAEHDGTVLDRLTKAFPGAELITDDQP